MLELTPSFSFHLAEGQTVRVLILLDETAAEKGAVQGDVKSVWERTAGAWQGNHLVRESQGSCHSKAYP